ncbi:RHS repeat-associated core domain-containing protein [Pseudomonas putida]
MRTALQYNKANQLTAEHWEDKRDGKTWSRIHSSTLQDRLKNTHEPYGEDTTHEYDAQGRLVSTLQGQLQAEFKYDDLGRIELITSHDRASAQALETKIEYDDQDREVKRTWRQPGQPERTQETVWDKDDLLLSRTLQVGGVSRLVEKFGYDSHARLNMYNCTGPDQPRDALGRSIAMQVFNFDAYNNIELTVTSFTGGPAAERATFIHAERDPCQLQRIEYTPPRTAPNPEFSYDANGNLTRDEQARPIRYDSQNRLLGLNDSGAPDTYGYDAGGLLVSRPEAGERTLLLHDGQRLRMAVRDSLQTLYLHHDEQALGQQQKGTGAQSPLLLHTSASHSVIAESQAGSTRAVRYTAYGERHADDPLLGTLGYNGEALDPDSGWYLLGSGYRAYNPVLMRFHSPDALSPFGAGAELLRLLPRQPDNLPRPDRALQHRLQRAKPIAGRPE